ncbi:putative inner dynein arm light chain; axonemal [Paratrimastix pyriformis]|uniref:Inner dynein arm light chain n=1 Tax=Paratrimastix pyriformis TaxID=342808 RepID=A0ABQ8UNJ6_9EUKA|nr:putative inner dynein arm light chain; axonemal [Paratrimastix pyriformis]
MQQASLLHYLDPEPLRRLSDGSLATATPIQPTPVEEALNAIFPPLVFEDERGIWQQRVDPTRASRLDAIKTQELLEQLIVARKAREDGICPVREQIYDSAFDELIRQESIDSPERGMLLIRIRDELRMRLAAFKTLQEGSLTYGLRKSVVCEQALSQGAQEITQLQTDCQLLSKQISELNGRLTASEKREAAFRAAEESKRKEEIAFLKNTVRQMKTQLELYFASQKREGSAPGAASGERAPWRQHHTKVGPRHPIRARLQAILRSLPPWMVPEVRRLAQPLEREWQMKGTGSNLLKFFRGVIFWLFTHYVFFYGNDFIAGLLLIYFWRLFERLYSSSRFFLYLLSSWMVYTLLGLLSLSLLPQLTLSPGPYGLVFGLLFQYFLDVPAGSHLHQLPFINDKILIYVLGAQLMVSQQGTCHAGILGLLTGLILRVAGVNRVNFSPRARIAGSRFFRFLDPTPSIPITRGAPTAYPPEMFVVRAPGLPAPRPARAPSAVDASFGDDAQIQTQLRTPPPAPPVALNPDDVEHLEQLGFPQEIAERALRDGCQQIVGRAWNVVASLIAHDWAHDQSDPDCTSPGSTTRFLCFHFCSSKAQFLLTADVCVPRADFQIFEPPIGGGSCGVVKRGKWLGTLIAVKRLHPELFMNTPSAVSTTLLDRPLNQFKKTIQTYRTLRHPKLVQFLGVCFERENICILSELMTSNLFEVLESRPLQYREVVDMALDVARACRYLHEKGLVHRDLCSSNVLVKMPIVKVSDMGLSQAFDTPHSLRVGHPTYAAPELFARDHPSYDEKVDCYSFGVLLAEMCTRQPPNPSKRPRQLEAITSAALRELATACVQRDPARRPPMAEIIHRLETLQQSQEYLTEPPPQIAAQTGLPPNRPSPGVLARHSLLEDLRNGNTALKEQLLKLNAEFEDSRRSMAEMDEALRKALVDVDGLRRRVGHNERTIPATRAKAASLQDLLTKRSAEADAAMQRVTQQELLMTERSLRVTQLEGELDSARQQLEMAEEQLKVLQAQSAKRDAQLADYRKQVVDLQSKISEQRMQITLTIPRFLAIGRLAFGMGGPQVLQQLRQHAATAATVARASPEGYGAPTPSFAAAPATAPQAPALGSSSLPSAPAQPVLAQPAASAAAAAAGATIQQPADPLAPLATKGVPGPGADKQVATPPPLSITTHPTQTPGQLRVLLAGAYSDITQLEELHMKLLKAFPELHPSLNCPIDTVDLTQGTPTPDELAAFDSVLLFSFAPFRDPVGLGDALAAYVESGRGGVVVCPFATNATYRALEGRFVERGYLPIQQGPLAFWPQEPLLWKRANPRPAGASSARRSEGPESHPIFNRVNQLDGGDAAYHTAADVAPGATCLARWSDGTPLVALQQIRGRPCSVVLNLFPVSSEANPCFWDSRTDGAALMANALRFVAE